MKDKHLLLISYVFPPYPGIGGRRWAKLAKYLSRKGWHVHVICAKNPFPENSLWTEDVQSGRITVHELPAHYPYVLLKQKLSFFDKLEYRRQLRRLRSRHRGTIYDRALDWEQALREKALDLIRKYAIRNVIATGAPFRVMHYTVKLKRILPELNVIVDFRDPWTSGKSYGIPELGAADMQHELDLERETVLGADTVLAPSEDIIEDLRARCGGPARFETLPHTFDKEDFHEEAPADPQLEHKLSFAFVGTVYKGADPMLRDLALVLQQLKKEKPGFYKTLRFDFYTSDHKHEALFEGLSDSVRFLPPRAPAALFATLRQYTYGLVLFTPQYKDFISTKFYELFHLRLPLLFVGPEGRVSRFLVERGAGLVLAPEEVRGKLPALLAEAESKKFAFDVDVEPFTLEASVEKLETLLR